MLAYTPINYSHTSVSTVLIEHADSVWARWLELSSWQLWDESLRGTESIQNGLALGKQFYVLPANASIKVPVTVASFADGLHFTTVSNGPLGLMSFGHTILRCINGVEAKIEHSICIKPNEKGPFNDSMWSKFRHDINESVSNLASMVSMEDTP